VVVEADEVAGLAEEVDDELVTLLEVDFCVEDVVVLELPQALPRFSRSEGSWVEAALAEAPVTLAVASLVTAAEMEAAIEAVSTVKVVDVEATALTGGPVAEGDGAFRTAAKSNCCGAGAAAAMRARAAAKTMFDLMVVMNVDGYWWEASDDKRAYARKRG